MENAEEETFQENELNADLNTSIPIIDEDEQENAINDFKSNHQESAEKIKELEENFNVDLSSIFCNNVDDKLKQNLIDALYNNLFNNDNLTDNYKQEMIERVASYFAKRINENENFSFTQADIDAFKNLFTPQAQMQAIENQIEEQQQINEKLQQENETIKQKNDTLKEENEKLNNNIENLNGEIKDQNTTIETLNAQIKELEEKLVALNQKMQNEIEQKNKELEEQQKINDTLKQENDTLKEENEKLKNNLNDKLNESDDLIKDLNNKNKELEKQNNDLSNKNNDLTNENNELTNKNNALVNENDELNKKNQDLENSLSEKDKEIEELKQQLKNQISGLNDQTKALNNQILEEKKKNKELEEKLKKQNANNKNLTKQLKDKNNELEQQKQNNEELKNQLNSNNNDLQNKINALNENNKNLSDKNNKLTDVNQSQQEEIEKLKQQLNKEKLLSDALKKKAKQNNKNNKLDELNDVIGIYDKFKGVASESKEPTETQYNALEEFKTAINGDIDLENTLKEMKLYGEIKGSDERTAISALNRDKNLPRIMFNLMLKKNIIDENFKDNKFEYSSNDKGFIGKNGVTYTGDAQYLRNNFPSTLKQIQQNLKKQKGKNNNKDLENKLSKSEQENENLKETIEQLNKKVSNLTKKYNGLNKENDKNIEDYNNLLEKLKKQEETNKENNEMLLNNYGNLKAEYDKLLSVHKKNIQTNGNEFNNDALAIVKLEQAFHHYDSTINNHYMADNKNLQTIKKIVESNDKIKRTFKDTMTFDKTQSVYDFLNSNDTNGSQKKSDLVLLYHTSICKNLENNLSVSSGQKLNLSFDKSSGNSKVIPPKANSLTSSMSTQVGA